MKGGRGRALRLQSEALLVRKVAYGEADLVVGLFTEREGAISVVARSARRSAKRFVGLEPMHLLDVTWEQRPEIELGTLIDAAIARPRLGLGSSLERLDAAGKALRWLRRAAPPHTAEPALWREINRLLDELDRAADPMTGALLSGAGLRLLAALGWGLDLERCVRCGKLCDPAATACVDAAAGGLVCRACGGARTVLGAERRDHLRRATAGEAAALQAEDVQQALSLVDEALAAHAGLER